MSTLEKHTGVYICSGCEIGNCIDVKKTCQVATEEYKVTDAGTHPALCSVEGYELILGNIEKHKLDTVVVAACSPRVKTEVFNFPDNILLERVNLREQVAWCFEPNDENTQMAAEDSLRMGIENAKNTKNPIPFIAENMSPEILIAGGGVTGMSAAIEGAKAGYTVHLVEKENALGGKQHELHKQFPSKAPFDSLIDPVLNSKLREIAIASPILFIDESIFVLTIGNFARSHRGIFTTQ